MFGHRLFRVEAQNKHCSISFKSSSGGGCSQWWHSQFVTWLEKAAGSAGRVRAVPRLGLSRSFSTRWHQRCCSRTSRVAWSAQCGCARFSFSQNLWLWGWGMGFPVGCNMESFFCFDFFAAFVIRMLCLWCRLLFTLLVFCAFFFRDHSRKIALQKRRQPNGWNGAVACVLSDQKNKYFKEINFASWYIHHFVKPGTLNCSFYTWIKPKKHIKF